MISLNLLSTKVYFQFVPINYTKYSLHISRYWVSFYFSFSLINPLPPHSSAAEFTHNDPGLKSWRASLWGSHRHSERQAGGQVSLLKPCRIPGVGWNSVNHIRPAPETSVSGFALRESQACHISIHDTQQSTEAWKLPSDINPFLPRIEDAYTLSFRSLQSTEGQEHKDPVLSWEPQICGCFKTTAESNGYQQRYQWTLAISG